MRKLQQQLQTLVNKYGYWSEEVKQFNSNLDLYKMVRVNNLIDRKYK